MFELFDPNDDFIITQGTNLPHWHQPGVTYFVTFRTDDSIPVEVADHWYAERDDWLRRHHVNPAASNFREVFGALPQQMRREYHDRFSADISPISTEAMAPLC